MIGKRGVSKSWSIVIIITLLVFVLGYFLLFFERDPEKLIPSDDILTGNTFYSSNPLTLEELKEGINLDKRWNYLVWTDESDEILDVNVAFASILENIYYIREPDSRKFWFNPNEKYSKYITHKYYSKKLFDKIKPGVKYRIYMKADDVLKYSFGLSLLKIIMPDGSIIIPDEDEVVYILNNKLLSKEEACSNVEDKACVDSELYDDFSFGTLDLDKWKVMQDTEGQTYMDEYWIEEGVFHMQQNSIGDRRTYLVPKYEFKAGDIFEYDVNIVSREGNYGHMILLTGGNYYRIGGAGYNGGGQPFDELGVSHFKLSFTENELNIERTSPSGNSYPQTLPLNGGTYELYIGSFSGHNGKVHMDFDNFYLR